MFGQSADSCDCRMERSIEKARARTCVFDPIRGLLASWTLKRVDQTTS